MSTPFYDLASLVVVPSGYKASKVYAQKPLTTDGQLTFSRASTATRVNSAGLIETVSSNVPRLDYLGSTCPKLQLEPSRTNAFPFSEAVSSWYEPDDGITITSNTTDTVSPDGTNNATKVTIVGGAQRNYQITNSTAGAGTLSLFVKAGTGSSILLLTSSGSLYCSFNLSTQVVTPTTGTGTITSYGNGWFRLTVSGTIGNTEVVQVIYGGAAGLTFYIWGAMIENGAYATSYVKTAGASSVTRLADACSKTGISSLIGQTEGTLFVDINYNGNKDVAGSVPIRIHTGNNEAYIFITNANALQCELYDITQQCGITGSIGAAGRKKIAFAYKQNNFVVYMNGVQIGTDTSGTVGAMANLEMGGYASGTNYLTLNGINQTLLFKTRLTNAQLAELTAL